MEEARGSGHGTGIFEAAFEGTPAAQRNGDWQRTLLATTALGSVLLMAPVGASVLVPGVAWANPTGGVVVGGGEAVIQHVPGVTTIDQASQRALINWKEFSIAPGELTQFKQPGTDAIALNRVVGNNASQIMGALKANGQVWLINPNGILFGPNARIDVHGILATTTDIADRDFMAGRYDFNRPSPNPAASVVNQGAISVGEKGLGALVAPHVRNDGVIAGKLGQVVLAGAETFTLDFYGDGLVQFAATSEVKEALEEQGAIVSNDGTISAEGGTVLITAAAASDVVDEVINVSGVVEAKSVAMKDGAIVLDGGDDGIVHVAGTLDASGPGAGEKGGTVKVLGEKVGLFDGARVDASGDAGGGEVLIGGNYQGKGLERSAERTIVFKKARVKADALRDGDGGRVIVWADEATRFDGTISARGGAEGGDGGFVEISGKQNLAFSGTVDLGITDGSIGTLLLDPADIVIIEGGFGNDSGPDDNQLDDNQILAGDPGAIFTISEAALESLPETADVILQATNNITIDSLVDDVLAFQATTGSVTFVADADGNGVGSFASGVFGVISTQDGDFTLDTAGIGPGTASLEIQTGGGDIAVNVRNGSIPNGLFLFADSSSAEGAGGAITIQASGDVFLSGRPLNVNSSGPNNGGTVSVTSTGGLIDMGNLTSSSATGTGGNVTISALNDVFTGTLTASGSTAGGNVSITSANASIAADFALEFPPPFLPINASASEGTGGNITLTAATGINIGSIDASGPAGSGAIAVTGNEVNLTGPVIGPGGDLLIQPFTPGLPILVGDSEDSGVGVLDVTTADLSSLTDGFASITIGRDNGSGALNVAAAGVTFNDPVVLRSPDIGGSIVVNGPVQMNGNALTLTAGTTADVNADLNAFGADITITSGGTIDTTGSFLSSLSETGPGGDINLAAGGGIITGGQLIAYGTTLGGNVSVTSDTGSITIGDVIAAGALVFDDGVEQFVTDQGGAITIQAAGNITSAELFSVGDIADGDITLTSTGGSVSVTDAIGAPGFVDGAGGDITIQAAGDITTASISAAGNPGAGAITLTSGNNIDTGDIDDGAGILDASSAAGAGGAITLTSSGNILTGGVVLGSEVSGLGGQPLTADAPGGVDFASGLTPNGADVIVGSVTRPTNILLPDSVEMEGGDASLFVANAYTFTSELLGAGNIFVDVNGILTLTGRMAATAAGDSIVLNTQGFVNAFEGEGQALDPGLGRFLVYSVDPANDTRNIPQDQFSKRYNFPFDPGDPAGSGRGLPPTGDFFLYQVTPELTLAVNPGSDTRVYGDPNPAFTVNIVGLIDDDTSADALSALPVAVAPVEESDVGAYTVGIGPEGLTSPVGYTLIPERGTLEVTPAPLTIQANNASRPFAAANPAFTAAFAGFKLEEGPEVIAGLQFNTPAEPSSQPGDYPIVPFGTTAPNYSISFISGTLTIEDIPLEIPNSTRPKTLLSGLDTVVPLEFNPPELNIAFGIPQTGGLAEDEDLLFSSGGNESFWGPPIPGAP